MDVGSFLGAVEASWRKCGELNTELNLIFKTSLPNRGLAVSVESLESHLEFLWVPVTDVDCYNLLPLSIRELVTTEPSYREAFWGSDLENA